ncbi:CbrC family protein [Streptomyces lincolnensis]|uniref:CbrC family protein n=1 Tax=Streptomyces lincolnensis TaxID=1915 RepID=UPI0037D3B855
MTPTAEPHTRAPRRGALAPACGCCGAARGYEAQFTEVDGRVPMDVVRAVAESTPGFLARQQPRWLTHCGDADGRPGAYLFRCRGCARRLAYADFT